MNAPAPANPSGRALLGGLLAVPLWLAVMHLPAPVSIEIFDAPPMALDYAVRHGIGLGTALPSSVGPLGAVLTPVHSGQPLWINFWAQALTGAVFAAGLAWMLARMNSPARGWVLGALLTVACFRPEYLHVSVLLLVGLMWLSQPLGPGAAAGAGLMLGLLGLIDVHFAWLGGSLWLLSRANPFPDTPRHLVRVGGVVWAVVLVGGWIASGQPAGELLPWLGHAWHPAARHEAAAWAAGPLACGLAAAALMTAALIGTVRTAPSRGRETICAGFVAAVLLLIWRRTTGQPGALPQLFFAAIVTASLGWLALKLSPAPRRWLGWVAGGSTLAGALGLLAVEPRVFTESIILLNRRMVANAAALTDRPAWQRGINDAFRGSAQLFALPRIVAATRGQRTDLLGNATAYALVNRLDFAPRPGLQSYRADDAALAARNADYYAGSAAPAYVVHRLQAFDRGLPALEDALAQQALYAHYDFEFEENGFVLWKRRPADAAPPVPRAEEWTARADWNQPVALPVSPGRAYWLTIEAGHSMTGWVKRQLLTPNDPVLVLRDVDGSALSYRAPLESLAMGFLVTPLFRSEIDLIRYQAGEKVPMICEVVLQKPAAAAGDFSGPITVRLREVAAPVVSGRRESAEAFAQRFRISDRLPVAVSAYYPPQITQLDGRDVLLAHPDSAIEFPVLPGDHSVAGRFGLLDAAHQNGNATDGVEFVVEYVPVSGAATVLFRRLLEPVTEPRDRGLQSFSVPLPPAAAGRVILRTQNPAGHNAAWDWSLWSDLRFAGPPATK